jgi:carbonic anhydrase
MPTVKSWLRNAEAALSVVQARSSVERATLLLDDLIEENVLLQISHLRTHPSVAARIAAGKMILSGWVYDIARGTVHLYDEGKSRFVPVEVESEPGLGQGASG